MLASYTKFIERAVTTRQFESTHEIHESSIEIFTLFFPNITITKYNCLYTDLIISSSFHFALFTQESFGVQLINNISIIILGIKHFPKLLMALPNVQHISRDQMRKYDYGSSAMNEFWDFNSSRFLICWRRNKTLETEKRNQYVSSYNLKLWLYITKINFHFYH